MPAIIDHQRSNHLTSKYKKNIAFVHIIKMKNLTEELKTIAEMRDIGGYESMSKERLISSNVKEKNFNDARIEKIKKDFNELRDGPSKQKIKEIRKDMYRIENKNIKEIEKNLKLEKILSKLKTYDIMILNIEE